MKLSQLILAFSVALAGMAPCVVHAQKDQKDQDKNKIKLDLPPYTGPKKRLGVMDLEVKITATATTNPTPTGGTTTTQTVSAPTNTDFGTGLSEMLTTALIDSGRFVVLERKMIADITTEQTLSTGPNANPNASVKGALLGAQALIRGAVTEFSYNSSSTGTGGALGNVLGLSHSSNEAKVVLDIRMYDPSTGVVLDSVQGTGKVKSSATGISANYSNISLNNESFQSSPLGDATRRAIAECVKKICDRMDKIPWEARIAELEADNSALYLNAGSSMGVKVGDEFDVFHAGRDIVDPETKTVIGRTKDTKIGHVKVDSVTPGVAILKIVDGTGFAINDVVHFANP